ncbi:hypothetical protein LCGC14_1961100 [marine sediment metagenome]|uniref:Uncharacterized protein n=1 Tax=marine sediment metagenome TaxID=412755 RepID=A0A0F9HSZ1_9ZZZZ
MAKKSLEDIRALVDPEGWLRALREYKTALEGNLAAVFLDYDMTEASPEIDTKVRARALVAFETTIRDLDWRIEEIQRRIDAATDGATGRAARRQGKKQRPKS